MRRIAVVVLLNAVAGFGAAAERPAKSRIDSVALFKNGLAVVTRTLAVDGPGTYCVEEVPQPIHGTFWVESDAKISTRLTRRVVEVPLQQTSGTSLQEDLAGREVVVHFADRGIPAVSGTVIDIDPPHGDDAWNRSYQQPRYDYNFFSSYSGDRRLAPGRMLAMTNETGRCYVDLSRIACVQTKGADKTVKQRKPVMILTVAEMKQKKATISVSYLAKGMAWAPSYRVDLSDPKVLLLRQNAVIKNELEAIEDAHVRLISGFPSVQFANVTSPLSLTTAWTTFFQQLNQRYAEGHAGGRNIVAQQAVAFNDDPGRGIDLSAIPTGEGVDLHYQDIGCQTLGEGDSVALETASAQAAYERIVEWTVPDTRHANGMAVSEDERNRDPEKYRDAAWDSVRFRNPLDFPMTTAPAMIVCNGRFNGQRLSHWVNPGEETTLYVTKALSIRTQSTEKEADRSPHPFEVGYRRCHKSTVEGQLLAGNHRKEAVTLVIRRRFSGELVSADQSPKQIYLEDGVYSYNRRNQLLWSVKLKPGEETRLTYRYTVIAPD